MKLKQPLNILPWTSDDLALRVACFNLRQFRLNLCSVHVETGEGPRELKGLPFIVILPIRSNDLVLLIPARDCLRKLFIAIDSIHILVKNLLLGEVL